MIHVIINIGCQFDKIENYLIDKLLGIYRREFQLPNCR